MGISVEETTVYVEDPVPFPRGADLPLMASVVPERLVHTAPPISFEDVRLTIDEPTPAHMKVPEAFGTEWSPQYHSHTSTSRSTKTWLCYVTAIIVAVLILGVVGYGFYAWSCSSSTVRVSSSGPYHSSTRVTRHNYHPNRPIDQLYLDTRPVAAQPGKTTVHKKHTVTPVNGQVFGHDGQAIAPGQNETTEITAP